jgi:hypothetical protein
MNRAALILMSLAAPAVHGQDAEVPRGIVRRVILDQELNRRVVDVLSASPGELTVVGERGRPENIPLSGILAWLPESAGARSAMPTPSTGESGRPRGLLGLADGQVLAGELDETTKGERVGWRSVLLGLREFSIEAVHAIAFGDATLPTGIPKEDTATFSNGDTLAGFISELGEANITIEVGGQPRRAEYERLRSVAFTTAVLPRKGSYLWLEDGSVLSIGAIAGAGRSSRELLVAWGGNEISVPIAQVVAFAADAGGLLGLSSLTPSAERPTPGRAWAAGIERGSDDAPLAAADVTLPGPMVVEWTLPAGAKRLSTVAVLPPASRVWGDCEVRLELIRAGQSTELHRARLNGTNPQAAINAPIDPPVDAGAILRVTLDPGERGPIQDRVVFVQPLLSLSPRR